MIGICFLTGLVVVIAAAAGLVILASAELIRDSREDEKNRRYLEDAP